MDIKKLIERAIDQNVMIYDHQCQREIISDKLKLIAGNVKAIPNNYVDFDMIILLFDGLRKYFDEIGGTIVNGKNNICLFYDSRTDKVLLGAY